MKRVVITGIGAVTPLADGAELSWQKILKGESGIERIVGFESEDISSRIAGQIPRGTELGQFSPENYMSTKEMKMMDDFIIFGMAASIQAIEDSGWKPETEEDRDMTGVLIGSGIGGLPEIERSSIELSLRGPRRISPFFIPSCLVNLISGNLSIKYGFSGPNHAVVSACATGAHAIMDAMKTIQLGEANVMISGGAEGAVCRTSLAGFASARALSTKYNDNPTEASRPWDAGRDGFVMAEGAGILVLEELEHAKKRNAKIYGEIIGYGSTSDAYHITAPHPEGRGGYRAMELAVKKANISVDEIDYVNAHGTSTPLGDDIELKNVHKLFATNDNIAMSSTKSSIGHLLGAAGSVEAIFCLLSMRDNIMPPTLNLHQFPEYNRLNLVALKSQEKRVDVTMSNSFGFGGTNACLVFRKI